MKNVKNHLRTLSFIFGFLAFGFANQASAQFLVVQNNTSCDIRFQAAESIACASCYTTPIQNVAAGTTAFIPNSGCSNIWEGIKYQPAPTVVGTPPGTTGGVSYNPAAGPCAPSTNGTCGGALISHTWTNLGLFTIHEFN